MRKLKIFVTYIWTLRGPPLPSFLKPAHGPKNSVPCPETFNDAERPVGYAATPSYLRYSSLRRTYAQIGTSLL